MGEEAVERLLMFNKTSFHFSFHQIRNKMLVVVICYVGLLCDASSYLGVIKTLKLLHIFNCVLAGLSARLIRFQVSH